VGIQVFTVKFFQLSCLSESFRDKMLGGKSGFNFTKKYTAFNFQTTLLLDHSADFWDRRLMGCACDSKNWPHCQFYTLFQSLASPLPRDGVDLHLKWGGTALTKRMWQVLSGPVRLPKLGWGRQYSSAQLSWDAALGTWPPCCELCWVVGALANNPS